jgi:hypothetical protein
MAKTVGENPLDPTACGALLLTIAPTDLKLSRYLRRYEEPKATPAHRSTTTELCPSENQNPTWGRQGQGVRGSQKDGEESR